MLGIKIASASAAVTALLCVAGCSHTSLTAEDAYKIGCPAIDATVAGGAVASDVAVSTLREVRDRAHPSQQTKRWLNAAIDLLTDDHPNRASEQTKKMIIDGCKRNGYPLQNLK